jgi:CRISPR/Cas system-associated exonuclease Cas4 (RecB family)
MVKILCPDGEERHIDDVYDAEYEHFPPVVIKALIAGRGKKRKRNENKKPRFGVTRLTGPCLRRSYYDLVEEVPITLSKLWIFSRGHAIHNFFQEHLDETENEIFLSQDFGLFDAIGYVDVLSDNVMYEFKTIQSIPDKPKPEHLMQIQSYYSMLSPDKQSKIKKLCIVYFSLNKIKTYIVPKLDMLNYLEARGSILANSLNTSIPPSREESYICNYCDFKDMCFKRDKDK